MNRMLTGCLGLVFLAASVLPAFAYEAFQGPLGLLQKRQGTYEGYTLLAPQKSKTTYLLDMDGKVVNEWKSEYGCFYAELLPDGNLLRHSRLPQRDPDFGGAAGLLEEFDWSGKKIWEYKCYTPGKEVSHHTFEVMPNHNVLLLVWEHHTFDEALAKGLEPETRGRTLFKEGMKLVNGYQCDGIWPDVIREVERGTGKVVWEWKVWDHVGTTPDKLDINAFCDLGNIMRALAGPDWTHFNGVTYNPETNEVAFTSRKLGEVFIIDYKSDGGIKYRWGNPGNYGKGELPWGYAKDGDQKLWGPHAPDWTPEGTLSIMDNGCYRPSGNYTRAVELDPKTNAIVWQWTPKLAKAADSNFYSAFQNGAQKLPNGNWMITTSTPGHIIEVTKEHGIVWEYVNPVLQDKVYALSNSHGGNGDPVHKALRYGRDWPGFKGRDMSAKRDLMPAGSPDWLKVFAGCETVPMPAAKQ